MFENCKHKIKEIKQKIKNKCLTLSSKYFILKLETNKKD